MFNESNTIEAFVRDLLVGRASHEAREPRAGYSVEKIGLAATGLGWQYIALDALPRQTTDVLIEKHLRDALVRLNPEIAAKPERADEVLYRLRAILLAVKSDGLVRANENFAAWLHGEHTMPFGKNNEHTTVRLIDFDDLSKNQYILTTQLIYTAGQTRRFDLVLFVNGIPLIVGEAKTPTRPAISWVDGAAQIHDDYELNVPAFFVPNVFSFATEGKAYRFGSIRMPLELWAPWRDTDAPLSQGDQVGVRAIESAIQGMLRPAVVLDILENFTLYATDKQHRKIKIICRYQQYQAANQLVERVVQGHIKKGLIWHFQGSGKSLLMVFAAQKLRMHPALKNPTVLIVVDRVDLDTQITATFNAADVPNMVTATTRDELQKLLAQDVRKIIITTIHKFGEASGVLNLRHNIIALVDEAHRTQEGDLGRKMREALPNAFLFGLTGTPINKRDRNTFWAFGADQDEHGYMSRYSFEESIRDKATLPLHFQARLVTQRVEKDAIDEAFRNITGDLSESDQAELAKRAAKMAQIVKNPERVRTIARDIVEHFQTQVEPNGFKAQIVTFDRESCLLYKRALDEITGAPEQSEVVMSVAQGDPVEWKKYDRKKDEEEKLLDRFRDSADPLKFLIVTARLLTGFDAPILQVMYLDKPMKEHNLLQAICRTNRPYPNKTHGLIVDYLGIFDEVARSLDFDDKSVQKVISNLEGLKDDLNAAVSKCLAYFPKVDRTVAGYEGLIAAQECLPDNDARDAFAADYSVLARLWEALSPDPVLRPFREDYRWLSQVYESIKPASGQGKLLWHALGAKTLELIHENIHVEAVHDDLETLILDENALAKLEEKTGKKKAAEIEIQISARLRKHGDNPKFIALGKRLEELKDRHERGLLTSIEFLKQLLELAKDVVRAEKQADTAEEQDRAKTALTELFNEARTAKTPIIVERIVADIDEIVRVVRFPGWQQTIAGERDVQKALRKTLLKYQLHRDQDLFDRAYGYIKQYY